MTEQQRELLPSMEQPQTPSSQPVETTREVVAERRDGGTPPSEHVEANATPRAEPPREQAPVPPPAERPAPNPDYMPRLIGGAARKVAPVAPPAVSTRPRGIGRFATMRTAPARRLV